LIWLKIKFKHVGGFIGKGKYAYGVIFMIKIVKQNYFPKKKKSSEIRINSPSYKVLVNEVLYICPFPWHNVCLRMKFGFFVCILQSNKNRET
jgi:hypothetical protein